MRGEHELETLTSVREKIIQYIRNKSLNTVHNEQKHVDVADCSLLRCSVQVQSGLSQEWGGAKWLQP